MSDSTIVTVPLMLERQLDDLVERIEKVHGRRMSREEVALLAVAQGIETLAELAEHRLQATG